MEYYKEPWNPSWDYKLSRSGDCKETYIIREERKMKSKELEKEYQSNCTTYTNHHDRDLTDRLDMIFKVLLEILKILEKK